MEYFKMNNGVTMPMEGIGVFLLSPKDAENAIYSALTLAHPIVVDTANAYMNEKAVRRAIQRSGVKREDIFLVSKLCPASILQRMP